MFRKFEKVTIRWIKLSTFRATVKILLKLKKNFAVNFALSKYHDKRF